MNVICKLILTSVLVLALAMPGWAAYTESHFVCSDGNGAGNEDGTTEADCWDGDDAIVWDTDDSADDKVGPNDILYLCTDGTYRETFTMDQSGTSGKPITISTEAGESPIIKSSDDVTTSGWADQGGDVWRHAIGAVEPTVVIFDGSTVGTVDATPDAKFEWTYSNPNLDVYATDDPDNEVYYTQIEAAQRSYGINTNGKEFLTFDGLDLRHSISAGIGVGGGTDSDIIIKNCAFSQAGMTHIGIWGTITAASTFLIQNSTFTYSGLGQVYGTGSAIDVTATDNYDFLTTVEECTFTHVGDFTGANYGSHGIYHKDGHLIWRYNFHTNGGTETGACVKLSPDADAGSVIEYNLFSKGSGTQVWGVLVEIASGPAVYNNVFYGVGCGVWQNTGGEGTTTENNIFHDAGGVSKFLRATSTTDWTSDYNQFYDSHASSNWDWNETPYTAVADWLTNSSQDANSPTPADPLMVDPANDDFSLQSTSPCIGAGVDLGVTYDDALDPESSWPDSVITVDQDT